MSSDRWHHASEPEGFAAWLGFHAGLTGTAVPEAGSDRREDLERRFSDALLAGYTVEQIRDASRAQAAVLLPEGAFVFLPQLDS
ncbi:MAG TPA: hypothetical protein PKD63_00135 [Solirubrobacteraceae bacterium]|nr:hypothetical protein [Solirubrobacteraceae bacterium]